MSTVVASVMSAQTPFPDMFERLIDQVTRSFNPSKVNDISIVYFKREIGEIFVKLFTETRDVNSTHKKWTLLHYCASICTHSGGRNLSGLMQALIRNNANPNARDHLGRTPIYFHSSGGEDDVSLKCLLDGGAEIKPQNDLVAPLHVTASGLWLRTRFLVERGANPYALDKFGRMPLHCLVIAPDFMMENAENLLENAPLSTEHADYSGNYPLYYAMIYGPDAFVKLLLKRTSGFVIQSVVKKLRVEMASHTFPPEHFFDDEIYHIDREFETRFGGMRRNAQKPNKSAVNKATSAAVQKVKHETYVIGERTYYLHPDRHGGKHLCFKEPKSTSAFLAQTIGDDNAALFYPEFSRNYNAMLAEAITTWADAGENYDYPFVTLSRPVGADNGVETNVVQVYYGDFIGSHIRPKYIDTTDRPQSLPAPQIPTVIIIERTHQKTNREMLKLQLEPDICSVLTKSYLSPEERHFYFGDPIKK